MKKLVLMIFLIGSMFMINAQDSTYVTNSNVEKLVDKYSSKIEAAVISLSESLQQPAEHVYIVLIRQQYVKASIGLSYYLLTIIFAFILYHVFERSRWKETSGYYTQDWKSREVYDEHEKTETYNRYSTLTLFIGAITIILFIGAAVNTSNILQGFINPEYGALQDIFELIGKL